MRTIHCVLLLAFLFTFQCWAGSQEDSAEEKILHLFRMRLARDTHTPFGERAVVGKNAECLLYTNKCDVLGIVLEDMLQHDAISLLHIDNLIWLASDRLRLGSEVGKFAWPIDPRIYLLCSSFMFEQSKFPIMHRAAMGVYERRAFRKAFRYGGKLNRDGLYPEVPPAGPMRGLDSQVWLIPDAEKWLEENDPDVATKLMRDRESWAIKLFVHPLCIDQGAPVVISSHLLPFDVVYEVSKIEVKEESRVANVCASDFLWGEDDPSIRIDLENEPKAEFVQVAEVGGDHLAGDDERIPGLGRREWERFVDKADFEITKWDWEAAFIFPKPNLGVFFDLPIQDWSQLDFADHHPAAHLVNSKDDVVGYILGEMATREWIEAKDLLNLFELYQIRKSRLLENNDVQAVDSRVLALAWAFLSEQSRFPGRLRPGMGQAERLTANRAFSLLEGIDKMNLSHLVQDEPITPGAGEDWLDPKRWHHALSEEWLQQNDAATARKSVIERESWNLRIYCRPGASLQNDAIAIGVQLVPADGSKYDPSSHYR